MDASQVAAIGLSVINSIAMLIIISVGLAVIFGMMGLINLAHGEFLMLGAYMTVTFYRLGLGFWVACLLGALSVGLFGVIIERCLVRFLYGRLAAMMLATWGLSLIIIQGVTIVFGTSTHSLPTPLGSFRIGSYSFSQYSIVVDVAAIAMLALVFVVFTRTRYGAMARASTLDPKMAAAIGIDVRRVNMLTFGFGAALSGLGGALLSALAGVVPTFGQQYVGNAFMTVISGGGAVLTGTASASVLLGGVQGAVANLSTAFLGSIALLVVAIVLLRFMPNGISGKWGRRF
ncbi:ABC transporter permease subunit [Terrabacter terrigena]|uniref:Branched-chain amino acid ABC transporter permease n=1 Tax=Terrabacter terrigena TaxID=574718 RepID=A0ABW3N2D6_9MICO